MSSIHTGTSVLEENSVSKDGALNGNNYKTYLNPCMFVGRRELVSLRDGSIISLSGDEVPDSLSAIVLQGSGDSIKCATLIEEIIWPSSNTPGECRLSDERCPIDGVLPPTMEDLHFYGMSAYYYALDCVRELGPNHIAHWYFFVMEYLLRV